MPKLKYNHVEVERRLRVRWEKDHLYQVDLKKASKPYYNLMMFPYPSAEGLHVGNTYAFTGSDVHGRFMRFLGYDVFEPIGLDGFGIHSENFALKQKTHPKTMAKKTEKRFYKQLRSLGNIYDWEHTLETYDPNYYKWTQWIFIQLFKAGLAVRRKAPVDFCPSCKTVLADEQVISGVCERCGSTVIQKELSQWFFTITKYAERLLSNLEKIDWTEKTKLAQRNWIGKKEGTVIKFQVSNCKYQVEVFTTRLDTICGATFMVLAPEHPLVQKITMNDSVKKVKTYIERAKTLTERERLNVEKEKTGVFTGSYCINPITKEEIQIWISDYVLVGYGTGAIMGVPAHDQRDYDFAKKFALPIKRVVASKITVSADALAYEEEGTLINSGKYNGLTTKEAIKTITKDLQKQQIAQPKVTYHLRDWLISRQRYWGPPIPMIHCERCGWSPVPEEDLPVLLPQTKNYQPTGTGESPLTKIKEFIKVKCPKCKQMARRETDVSDTFLDSAWYFLRYPSAHSIPLRQVPWDKELTKKWLPVTMYIGGHEHAVLHLLYSRFLTMVLSDLGCVHFEEPFAKFRAHGLLTRDGAKMSKSKGNVVVPDSYIHSHGIDALRTYLMFSGPFSEGGNWTDRSLEGVSRFLKRVWVLAQGETLPVQGLTLQREQVRNQAIKRVTEDLNQLHYNTAIATLMEYVNFLSKQPQPAKQEIETLLLLLAPFAPFITEELWEKIGNPYSIHNQKWPLFDPKKALGEAVTVVVQVDGKLRDRLEVPPGTPGKQLERQAISLPRIKKYVGTSRIAKVIVVPDKLINFVLPHA